MHLVVAKASEKDVYRDIIRIHETFRKDPAGTTVPEGVVCKVAVNGRRTHVLIRGLGDDQKQEVHMDERTRNCLGLELEQDAELQINPVGLWGQFCWAWSASDPAYRVSARLAALSVGLGVLSVVLTVLQFFR